MERRGFISLAFLLPFVNSLKSIFKDDELLRFELTALEPLLKNISASDSENILLLKRNLAYDVQYVLERLKNPKDMESIKALAAEADKKFYSENKLKATRFGYQPLNIPELEKLRKVTVADTREFDGMIKDIREQLADLEGSSENFARVATKKLSITGVQKQPAKTAGEIKKAQECAKTWTTVGAIIAVVVIIIVAILVSIFSFGATTGGTISSPVILGLVSAAPFAKNRIVITGANIRVDDKDFSIKNSAIDLSKFNLDEILKCSTSVASVASAMSLFGQSSYPAKPIAGSMVVSFFGIASKIPGYGVSC